MSDPKAMNLRFPDPAQRAAIAAAAKQAGVSTQENILSAAYDRATAVERRFVEGFRASMSRSGAAFAAEPGTADPSAEQRAAEQEALRELQRTRVRAQGGCRPRTRHRLRGARCLPDRARRLRDRITA